VANYVTLRLLLIVSMLDWK